MSTTTVSDVKSEPSAAAPKPEMPWAQRESIRMTRRVLLASYAEVSDDIPADVRRGFTSDRRWLYVIGQLPKSRTLRDWKRHQDANDWFAGILPGIRKGVFDARRDELFGVLNLLMRHQQFDQMAGMALSSSDRARVEDNRKGIGNSDLRRIIAQLQAAVPVVEAEAAWWAAVRTLVQAGEKLSQEQHRFALALERDP